MTITAEEFERRYAAASGMTVERLRQAGRVVRRCRCGEDVCDGWQSISYRSVLQEEQDWRQGLGKKPDWLTDGTDSAS